MKHYNKLFVVVVVGILIIPQITLAAWWNPLSWNWSALFNNPPQEQMVSTTTSSDIFMSTSTPVVSTTTVATASSTVEMTAHATSTPPINQPIKIVKKVSSPVVVQNQSVSATPTSLTCPQGYNCAPTVSSQPPIISPTVPTIAPSTASISADYNNPLAHTVSAVSGQYPSLPVLTFDIVPSNNDQTLDSLAVSINYSGQGSVNTANLYVSGLSTPIATAVVSNGSATFSDIQSIPSLSTNLSPYDTFIVKVNVSGLTDVGSSESVSASVSSAEITDAAGHNVSVAGTAQGKVISVDGTTTVQQSTTPPQTGFTCEEVYVFINGIRTDDGYSCGG